MLCNEWSQNPIDTMNIFHTHAKLAGEFKLDQNETKSMGFGPMATEEAKSMNGKYFVVVGAPDSKHVIVQQTFIFNTDSNKLTQLDAPKFTIPTSNAFAMYDGDQNGSILTSDDNGQSFDSIECIQVDQLDELKNAQLTLKKDTEEMRHDYDEKVATLREQMEDTTRQCASKTEYEEMRLDFEAKVATLHKQMEDTETRLKIEQQIVETINQRARQIQIEQELKEVREERDNLIAEKEAMRGKVTDTQKDLMSSIEEKDLLIQEYERQRRSVRRLTRQTMRVIAGKILRRRRNSVKE